MIVAIHKSTYIWVDKNKEHNCGYCFVGTTKALVREAIAEAGFNYKDYAFFTDKTGGK
jgi:hypothetical protein